MVFLDSGKAFNWDGSENYWVWNSKRQKKNHNDIRNNDQCVGYRHETQAPVCFSRNAEKMIFCKAWANTLVHVRCSTQGQASTVRVAGGRREKGTRSRKMNERQVLILGLKAYRCREKYHLLHLKAFTIISSGEVTFQALIFLTNSFLTHLNRSFLPIIQMMLRQRPVGWRFWFITHFAETGIQLGSSSEKKQGVIMTCVS